MTVNISLSSFGAEPFCLTRPNGLDSDVSYHLSFDPFKQFREIGRRVMANFTKNCCEIRCEIVGKQGETENAEGRVSAFTFLARGLHVVYTHNFQTRKTS